MFLILRNLHVVVIGKIFLVTIVLVWASILRVTIIVKGILFLVFKLLLLYHILILLLIINIRY